MMEYVTPNIEVIHLLVNDVITTSLKVGEETKNDSDTADNMGF